MNHEQMTYEVVQVEEKTVVGVSTQTGNEDPQMHSKIGTLWQQLYQGQIYETIQNKANAFAIGLYSDYTKEGYTVTVGAEVTNEANPSLTKKIIPAGSYACFTIRGDMVTAVAKAWATIWEMDLKRSFSGDFEEYREVHGQEVTIYIYIALQE